MATRPAPKDAANAGLVFVTKYGTPWVKDSPDSPVTHDFGKLLIGTSGLVVDHIGYPRFYLYTASLSIPPLLLLYLLSRQQSFAAVRLRTSVA